ncbi:sirohydrochlorin cobaltochelatase [Oscillospiraceae bacterium MB08-C2-2]|nr:sirohydrochlorin cobaltochelatase [Oscillospiraceae bacterium MB08-C2-2]
MKKALIVTSFGTTHKETLDRCIEAVEAFVAENMGDYTLMRAFTSSIIRSIWRKRGVEIDDLAASLQKAQEAGVQNVVVLPTHLLYGEEYERILAEADRKKNLFESLTIAPPLLASTEDMRTVAQAVAEAFPVETGRCVALMGHGTEHTVNTVYGALGMMFRQMGRPDILVGTVEAYPGIEEITDTICKEGFDRVLLAPLMLVAGDHARNDMAGEEPESWKSILEAKGLEVECVLRGLGEYPAIRRLYLEHARQAAGLAE